MIRTEGKGAGRQNRLTQNWVISAPLCEGPALQMKSLEMREREGEGERDERGREREREREGGRERCDMCYSSRKP